jgi:hypothetical protein
MWTGGVAALGLFGDPPFTLLWNLYPTSKPTLKISGTPEFSSPPVGSVRNFFPKSTLLRQTVGVPLVTKNVWLEFRCAVGKSTCVYKTPQTESKKKKGTGWKAAFLFLPVLVQNSGESNNS